MYYLNSRYYNPEIGRFINSDGFLGAEGNILSTNLYAYCHNNPVTYTDEDGYSILVTTFIISAVASFISKYIEDIMFNYMSGLRGNDVFRFASSIENYIAVIIGGGLSGVIDKLVPGSGKIINALLVPFTIQLMEVISRKRVNFDPVRYIQDAQNRFLTSMLTIGVGPKINGRVLNAVFAVGVKVVMSIGTTTTRAVIKFIRNS
jgi:hypothetical protein